MQLLSLYIQKHFLFQKPECFNFGGEFYFEFNLQKDLLHIEKKENLKYIPNLYGKAIKNISALVGNNGVGKTSILRILNQEQGHPIISIYSDGNDIVLRNQSKLKIEANFNFVDYKSDNELYPLYYSSLIDYNIKRVNSPISQSSLFDDSLSEYYYDSILRQVFFLNNKSDYFNKNYDNFPSYENIRITVNNIEKREFLNNFNKKSTSMIGVVTELEMLWDEYPISKEGFIHNEDDFVTNFEVFILSLLVSDDTFAETNDNAADFGFQDVLNQDTFKKKLEVFLKKRISNIDGPTYKLLESYFDIKIENEEDLIERVKSNKLSQISGGFDFRQIKNHIVQTIIRFSRIFELYNFITSNESRLLNFKKREELEISVHIKSSMNYLERFFNLFEAVYKSLQYITFEYRLFNINPEKKLSTGELSLLNFYSSIYNFTFKTEHHLRKHKQYLLLLDEPETGYHAVWKKKFIQSITDVLPELFSELKNKPSIQIIFTTHDALTLSDIPNYSITYMKRLKNETLKVYTIEDSDRPQSSFGGNISDLLSHSFFIDDGLIGDFSKSKINETITWLNYEKLSKEITEITSGKISDKENQIEIKITTLKELQKGISNFNKEYHKKIIQCIDEPVLKTKLLEMYSEVYEDPKEHLFQELKKLADDLGYDIQPK